MVILDGDEVGDDLLHRWDAMVIIDA